MTKKGDSNNPVQMVNAPLIENEENNEELEDIHQVGKAETITPEEAHVFPISIATILFHVLMMFACLYYGLLLTNWGEAHIDSEETDVFQTSGLSFWIKISAQWICFFIYTFSLVGPLICPNRDWS